MLRLTRQEQTVLIVVILLLATGWAVRTFRSAKPPAVIPSNALSP